jgi:hypothetical protein
MLILFYINLVKPDICLTSRSVRGVLIFGTVGVWNLFFI